MIVLKTICCDFEFWGWNHSPQHEGNCRNCLGQWQGAKRVIPKLKLESEPESKKETE